MVFQFTLQDLMAFLVCALAIAAGALLIPILWNIKKVVGIVRPLVEANQAGMKKSLSAIPGIVENVEQISSGINESVSSFRQDASEQASGFMAYLPIIKEVLQLILRAFSPK